MLLLIGFELFYAQSVFVEVATINAYANHMLGVQVMATISLQCNSLSQIHPSVFFRLKIV